jgi:hypothetical protein
VEPENSEVLAAHTGLLARALDFEGADRALTEVVVGDPEWAPYLAQVLASAREAGLLREFKLCPSMTSLRQS